MNPWLSLIIRARDVPKERQNKAGNGRFTSALTFLQFHTEKSVPIGDVSNQLWIG
jgi:hypothetical protein